MQIKEKPRSFLEVRKYLSDIPSINQGGCGVAALAMYKWLVKKDKIDYTFSFVLCYNYQTEEYVNNSHVLRTRKGDAVACHHVVIYYEQQFLDCNGKMEPSIYDTLQFVKYDDAWFMQNAINNKSSWNSMFDRKTWVPEIEEMLDISLKEIKK